MDGEPVVRPDVSSSTQGVQALGEGRVNVIGPEAGPPPDPRDP